MYKSKGLKNISIQKVKDYFIENKYATKNQINSIRQYDEELYWKLIRGGGRRKTAGRGAGAGFIPGTGEKHGRRLVPGRKFPRMPLCPQDSPFQGMRACSGKTKFFKSAVIQVLILSSPSLFFKNHFLL